MKYKAIFLIGGELSVDCFNALARIVGAAQIFKPDGLWREGQAIRLLLNQQNTALQLRETLRQLALWWHYLEENTGYYPWILHVVHPQNPRNKVMFGCSREAMVERVNFVRQLDAPVYWGR